MVATLISKDSVLLDQAKFQWKDQLTPRTIKQAKLKEDIRKKGN